MLRRWSIAVLAVTAALGTAALAQPAAPTDAVYDLVIRGGRVLDGMGNPWIRADIAILDGRFAAIGQVTGRGRQEIDATGRYVSPGWIDMMDQSGGALPINGLAENKLRMGVTTAIGGEGGTPVPADRIAAYFADLEQKGISINFGSYYSEAQARTAILGNTARAPTSDEMGRMQGLMETAMRAGAMGMTTALIYPPGSFASTDELVEVAKVAARYGGVYATHLRDEGRDLLKAVDEAIAIGERAGLPVEIFHLKAAFQPGWGTLMPKAGAAVEAARARGVDVAADLYVYTAGGTGLEASIPTWAQEGGRAALVERLADPETRARLKREIASGLPGWSNMLEAAGGWNGIVLSNAQNPDNAAHEGKSIADIAKALGKDPADTAFDLVAQGKGRVMAIFHMMSEPDIETALRFTWTSIGSDAGAAIADGGQDPTGLTHPRAYGNFPRVLARYVRDRGVLTLEQAVRKMTSWPASRMRLAHRGSIKEGHWADVVVFDLASLDDAATFAEPRKTPRGIDYVLVNGVVVVDHGRHTGARPGRVLYGAGRSQPASFLIAGAQVADGTGAPLRVAAVRVEGDTIAAVGALTPRPGEPIVDGTGLVLAPGFIDAHNHSTDGLEREREAVTQVSQGITTLAVGQDGSSPWPVADYLARLRASPPAVNVVVLAGHATVRRHVLGDDYKRRARPAEVARMRTLVDQAMREGAFGVSSGLEYEVGGYADIEEVVEMARAAAARGGFYISHIRDEADLSMDAIREAIAIGERGRLPVQITHIKLGTVGVWGKAKEVVALVEAARQRGVDVTADAYPYLAWQSTPRVLVPNKRYDDPASVKKGLDDIGGARNVQITRWGAYSPYIGKRLDEMARGEAISDVEAYIRFAKDDDAGMIGHAMIESDLRTFYQQPWVMVASDGGIANSHPRGAGTFPRVLGRYVRDEQWLSLPEAIRKMTSMPAARLRLRDRGEIAPGKKADLVLIDPATVIDRSTFEQPRALSTGIVSVWVNGAMVWDGSGAGGRYPGRVLTPH